MKDLITILTISATLAISIENPTIAPIEQLFKNEISYPDDAKLNREEGVVLVSFSVNEEGHIIVKESNANNENRKNCVLGKLAKQILP